MGREPASGPCTPRWGDVSDRDPRRAGCYSRRVSRPVSLPLRLAAAPLLLLVCSLGATGCATVRVPYPLERTAPEARAVHALTIAVLPLVDARQGPDRDSKEPVFVYRGVELTPTRLDRLAGTAERDLAELLARHLVRAGVFARVVLVDHAKEAPEAELFLRARLRRARGYVEARARDAEALRRRGLPATAEAERTVLAEVWLQDLEVVDRTEGAPLFRADVGWSIAEDRRVGEDAPDPYAVMGEALWVAYGQAAELLRAADLSGATRVEPRTALRAATTTSTHSPPLEALEGVVPPGWATTTTTSTTPPPGWRRLAGACRGAEVTAQHTQRFHRVLGPYVPRVAVWWCSADSHLRYDPTVEFPAVYAGEGTHGERLFVHTVGASAWAGATEQLAAFFRVAPPPGRYVFEVGGPRGTRAVTPPASPGGPPRAPRRPAPDTPGAPDAGEDP